MQSCATVAPSLELQAVQPAAASSRGTERLQPAVCTASLGTVGNTWMDVGILLWPSSRDDRCDALHLKGQLLETFPVLGVFIRIVTVLLPQRGVLKFLNVKKEEEKNCLQRCIHSLPPLLCSVIKWDQSFSCFCSSFASCISATLGILPS